MISMSTGKPIYYYNGQQLNNERFFKFKGEHRVEGTLPNGERVVVPAKDITTERPTTNTATPKEVAKPEAKAKEEVKEQEPKVEEPTPAEEPTEEPTEEEVSEFEGQVLLVEDSNGDVSELTYGSDDFNKVVDKHKLDLEAIDRMLNNEQKTHKGFSFELA